MYSPLRSHLVRAGLVLLLAGSAQQAVAQDFLGIANSNNAGILGLDLNPANIVDSRFRFDVGIAGNMQFWNDHIGLRTNQLFNASAWGDLSVKNYSSTIFRENMDNTLKNVYANASIMWPSFMLTTSPRSAIALTLRSRILASFTDVDSRLARMVITGFEAEDLLNRPLSNNEVNMQVSTFQEVGFTYGRVLFDKGKHFFKAAARVKYLIGTNSFYAQASNLNYQFYNRDSLQLNQGTQFRYGFSDGLEFRNLGQSITDVSARATPGVGFDIGFVYEFRPRYRDFRYEMDGETDLPTRDQNKYRWKIGLSITDIGRVYYKKGGKANEAYELLVANGNGAPPAGPNQYLWDIGIYKDWTMAQISADLRSRFATVREEGEYSVSLPTKVSLQVDFRATRNLFLNLTTVNSVINERRGTRTASFYMLTPRFEGKRFDVALPLSVSNLGDFNMGVAARLGPVMVGSNSLLSFAVKEEIKSIDFFFAVRVPLRHPRPADKDKDKVSNGRDKCPDVFGTWEFEGCPDTDGDHIPDSEDKCPEQPGLPQFFGCPDTDGDGVPDSLDGCPDKPGQRSNGGCPAGTAPTNNGNGGN